MSFAHVLHFVLFFLLANNDKKTNVIRRKVRIASKDISKHHGTVHGMITTTYQSATKEETKKETKKEKEEKKDNQSRIYVYGDNNGTDLLTAWTVGKHTKLQLKLVGRVKHQDLTHNEDDIDSNTNENKTRYTIKLLHKKQKIDIPKKN